MPPKGPTLLSEDVKPRPYAAGFPEQDIHAMLQSADWCAVDSWNQQLVFSPLILQRTNNPVESLKEIETGAPLSDAFVRTGGYRRCLDRKRTSHWRLY
jgi:hypothetical protein